MIVIIMIFCLLKSACTWREELTLHFLVNYDSYGHDIIVVIPIFYSVKMKDCVSSLQRSTFWKNIGGIQVKKLALIKINSKLLAH